MKKKFYLSFLILFFVSIAFCSTGYAKEKNIVLNQPQTDDIEHTFKYPNLQIGKDVIPYSITLSIENGYFITNNLVLNNAVSEYFLFKGGTNISDEYVSTLTDTENYKLITFNIKSEVDLSNEITRKQAIKAIKEFLSDILFYNETDMDTKFTLTFSETEMKLSDESKGLDGIDIIAFKDPSQAKEHYYAKILAPNIKWSVAYDIAAGLKWNGLQGYLVTITSEAEHNFIYQSLGSIQGWMGAAAITNYDSITYNQPGISWGSDYTSKLKGSYKTGGVKAYDDQVEKYWHWVSGPEAGQTVFGKNKYTNFNVNEPNNSGNNEWCAEYGFGEGGKWNDYPNSVNGIEGYYIEFGGFAGDEEVVKPVTLVNTFKWKDYDFRNINQRVEEKLKDIVIDEETDLEEIQKLVDEAIEESEIESTTAIIKNRKIINNTLTFDIEIIIGEGENSKSYIIKVTRALKVENPNTIDNLPVDIKLLIISFVGFIISIIVLKKEKRI